jgi:hypothetical protein
MTISKRVLTKWRKESLIQLQEINSDRARIIDRVGFTKALNERILALTQELIDQELLKEVNDVKR